MRCFRFLNKTMQIELSKNTITITCIEFVINVLLAFLLNLLTSYKFVFGPRFPREAKGPCNVFCLTCE